MSPWEVIEEALARRRPSRDQAWLAEQLERCSPQAINNWKRRNAVPKGRFLELADVLGLTARQIAGQDPPPWQSSGAAWPFPDIDPGRWAPLSEMQRGEIQAKVREMIEAFEATRPGSGKSTPSGHGAGPPKTGT